MNRTAMTLLQFTKAENGIHSALNRCAISAGQMVMKGNRFQANIRSLCIRSAY